MIRKSLSVIGAAVLLLGGASAEAQEQYRVTRGDTLYGISKRYGISIQELMQSNSLRDSLIHPGQSLVIPGSQSSSTGYSQDYNAGSTTTYTPYEPYSGSTSSATSSSNTTTPDYNQESNQYNNTQTATPQVQYGEQRYIVHTVQHGDSLWSIGQRYGQSVNTIKQLNQLDCNHIQCGQKIYVPAVLANNNFPSASCNKTTCELQPSRTVRNTTTSYGY